MAKIALGVPIYCVQRISSNQSALEIAKESHNLRQLLVKYEQTFNLRVTQSTSKKACVACAAVSLSNRHSDETNKAVQ